ncbi:MAG: ABC transporter permease [Bdellovibrionales bacterium]
MKKYFQLYKSFFKASMMSDLEYRLNIITKVFTDILWYAAQASVFEVLFRHAPNIAGWDLQSARVFMAVLFLADALWMVFFHENFERLSWKVRRGELDLVLAKPVDSQFLLTVQKQNTSYVINSVLTFVYLLWTLSQTADPQWWRIVLLLVVGLPSGLAISYSFRLMFATLSVVYTNAESVNYVWYQIYRLGMRPDTFYPKWLRLLVLTLLPVGFVASVPTRILLENLDVWLLVGGPLAAAFTLSLARWCWAHSLVHYSSASS